MATVTRTLEGSFSGANIEVLTIDALEGSTGVAVVTRFRRIKFVTISPEPGGGGVDLGLDYAISGGTVTVYAPPESTLPCRVLVVGYL